MEKSTETPTEAGGRQKALLNRNFVLLWQGQLVSQLGTQAYAVAMMFWIKHATGSATIMGLLMMAGTIPLVLLSPFGGTMADRLPRKRLIVLGDLVEGVAALSLAALVFLAPDRTSLIIGWLVGVSVVSGIVQSFFRPAITAAIPGLVPEDKVAAANSLNEGSVEVATLFGQAIGGVLFKVLGAPVLFLLDGLSFLFSAISESFITIEQELPERADSWRETARHFNADLREGVAFVWNNKGMRSLMLTAAVINFFAMPFLVLLPFFVEDTLGVGADWFGYLLAGFGAGGVIGFVAAGTLKPTPRVRMLLMILALLAVSATLALVGMTRTPWIALLILAGGGVFHGLFNIWVTTLFQTTTPDSHRGRVFGLLHTLVMGLAPISLGLTGVVADMLDQNTPLMFVSCGAILTVVTLVASANPHFRRYLASDTSDAA
jgi:DHA3 family macrolide efflux protein-like MFS transporter